MGLLTSSSHFQGRFDALPFIFQGTGLRLVLVAWTVFYYLDCLICLLYKVDASEWTICCDRLVTCPYLYRRGRLDVNGLHRTSRLPPPVPLVLQVDACSARDHVSSMLHLSVICGDD